MRNPATLWGVRWESRCRLDGHTTFLVRHLGTRLPVLFLTRAEARAWIDDVYGYIKLRPDIRAEPHGWRMPKAVRVTVEEAKP